MTEQRPPIPRQLLEKNPDLPAIMDAIDSHRRGEPVTQVSLTTGRVLEVLVDDDLGILTVASAGKELYRARFTPGSRQKNPPPGA